MRTQALPESFGAVFGDITASSDTADRAFYQEALFNRYWGEQMAFRGDNVLHLSMVFQGMGQKQAETIRAPFLEWVRARKEYTFRDPVKIFALPARHFWDAAWFRQHAPGILASDERAGASPDHVVWAGDKEQAGWFIHGYQSAWMPQSLLGQSPLCDALFAASRHWDVALHLNKGLVGARRRARRDARYGHESGGAGRVRAGDPRRWWRARYPGMPGAALDTSKGRGTRRGSARQSPSC